MLTLDPQALHEYVDEYAKYRIFKRIREQFTNRIPGIANIITLIIVHVYV